MRSSARWMPASNPAWVYPVAKNTIRLSTSDGVTALRYARRASPPRIFRAQVLSAFVGACAADLFAVAPCAVAEADGDGGLQTKMARRLGVSTGVAPLKGPSRRIVSTAISTRPNPE